MNTFRPVLLVHTNFSDLKGSWICFEPGYKNTIYEELVEGKFPDATATILEVLAYMYMYLRFACPELHSPIYTERGRE